MDRFCGILSDYFAPSVPELKQEDMPFRRALAHNFLDTLAASALAASKKLVYGEKFTPYRGTALRAIAALEEYHPKIKFVNLTRDGRDVIASGAAHWLNLRLRKAKPEERPRFEEALRNHTILQEDFDMFLDCWMDAVQAGLAACRRFPNYLRIRYEDFVQEPCGQTAKLFDFLGLKSSKAAVRGCVEATSFNQLSQGRKRGEEDLSSFFRKGIVGDWKNWFTSGQLASFEETAGSFLAELGYQCEEPGSCQPV